MKTSAFFLALILLFSRINATAAPSPFALVMIDEQTEIRYGTIPFNRALIAKAIDKLSAADARAIVIKFFYDLPSTEENDKLLSRSICGAHVVLQGSLNDSEGITNGLANKFTLGVKPIVRVPKIFAGEKALIPLEQFSQCADAIGFVDSTSTEIPLIEIYQHKMVKSLYLVALELASGQTAEIGSDGNIKFGQKRLSVMHHIEFQSTNVMSYIPLHEIIDGKSTEWQEKVRHSVVILGYDGRNIHSIDTPIGPLTAHRFFVCGLMSLYKTSLLSDLEPR